MKKYSILAAVLVLTVSVFTGCGCRKQMTETMPPSEATLMPTEAPATIPATVAPTENTTPATEDTLIPDGTDTNGMDGTNGSNGTDATGGVDATEDNTARSRARVK